MSLPPYLKYKDSGVDWLREVPEHWQVGKFRHSFLESPEKIEDHVVGEMLSVSGYRGVEVKEYDDDNRRRLEEDLVGYRIVRKGQLVVNTMWLNYAGLGVSDLEGHVSPAYRSYWISEAINKRYIHHLMRCDMYVKGYTSLLAGIRPNSLQMSRNDLMEFPVILPPRNEQAKIAAFLNRETAKIDALVDEQRRLIELLKEKRQAIISHSVTKGLNPDAPMKDSGVEWLGEVPEHWRVLRVKHVSKFTTSGPRGWSDRISEAGSIFVQSGDLNDTLRINIEGCKRVLVEDGVWQDRYDWHHLCRFYGDSQSEDSGIVWPATLVAFSGEVHDAESGPEPFKETSKTLNPNMRGRSIRDAFDTDEYQILLVANKFQTGFDQPLLCGMYVDKRLAGIQAVQTLSRLNRSYDGKLGKKATTFVLDFVNDPAEILESFKVYYQTAELENVTDPNIIFNLRSKLDAVGFYDDFEVDRVVKVELNPASKQSDLIAALEPVRERILTRYKAAQARWHVGQEKQDTKATKEAKDEIDSLNLFKQDMGTFLRAYTFLSQIFDYGNTAIESRAIFYRRLLPLLEFGRERDEIDLSKVSILTRRMKAAAERASKNKENGAFLFICDTDATRPLPGIQSTHARALRESKVARFRPYDCRHTWATRAVQAGIDLVTLAAMLGHSKINMVLRYAHPTQEHQTTAMDKMERYVSEQKIAQAERIASQTSQAVQ